MRVYNSKPNIAYVPVSVREGLICVSAVTLSLCCYRDKIMSPYHRRYLLASHSCSPDSIIDSFMRQCYVATMSAVLCTLCPWRICCSPLVKYSTCPSCSETYKYTDTIRRTACVRNTRCPDS